MSSSPAGALGCTKPLSSCSQLQVCQGREDVWGSLLNPLHLQSGGERHGVYGGPYPATIRSVHVTEIGPEPSGEDQVDTRSVEADNQRRQAHAQLSEQEVVLAPGPACSQDQTLARQGHPLVLTWMISVPLPIRPAIFNILKARLSSRLKLGRTTLNCLENPVWLSP